MSITGWPGGMNRTTCIGMRQANVRPSMVVDTSYMRTTSQYCMVSACAWLWLVMIFVVVPMVSLALARRIPVRCALRWAEAVFSALEWVA